MTTTIRSYISPDGLNPDSSYYNYVYTNLKDWWQDPVIYGDITANGRNEMHYAYLASGTHDYVFYMSGNATTDSGHYYTITPAANAQHRGTLASVKAIISPQFKTTFSPNQASIEIAVPYTVLDGVPVGQSTFLFHRGPLAITANNCTIHNCLFFNSLYSSFFVGPPPSGSVFTMQAINIIGSNTRLYNNMIFNIRATSNTRIDSYMMYDNNVSTSVLVGNIVGSTYPNVAGTNWRVINFFSRGKLYNNASYTAFYGYPYEGCFSGNMIVNSGNASSDNTGSSGLTGVSVTGQLVYLSDLDNSAFDFHQIATSIFINAGVTPPTGLGVSFTDIDGNLRPVASFWDVGVSEYVLYVTPASGNIYHIVNADTLSKAVADSGDNIYHIVG